MSDNSSTSLLEIIYTHVQFNWQIHQDADENTTPGVYLYSYLNNLDTYLNRQMYKVASKQQYF